MNEFQITVDFVEMLLTEVSSVNLCRGESRPGLHSFSADDLCGMTGLDKSSCKRLRKTLSAVDAKDFIDGAGFFNIVCKIRDCIDKGLGLRLNNAYLFSRSIEGSFFIPGNDVAPIFKGIFDRVARVGRAEVALPVIYPVFILLHPFSDCNGRIGRVLVILYACACCAIAKRDLAYLMKCFSREGKDLFIDAIANMRLAGDVSDYKELLARQYYRDNVASLKAP